MRDKHRLSIILIVCALMAGGILFGYNGGQGDIPEVDGLQTIEGHVSKVNTGEYYLFEVTFQTNGESKTARCAASTNFDELCTNNVPLGTKVLAVVDMVTLTGTVFDSVETYQPEEPVPE